MQPDPIKEEPFPPGDAALYDQYGAAIFGYLRLHTKSLEDAEDLLLEVFLAALEHDNLASLPFNERLAWLRRVVQRKLANAYRYSYRHPQVSLGTLAETPIENDQPELQALRQEEFNVLRQYIRQLPVSQQQVLQLRYAEGLRYTEIAVLLQKREDAVRQLLARAIRFLRCRYLPKEGE